MQISKRIPRRQELVQVLAVIALVIYGWTLVWFFWKVGSWLYFLSIGEILGILSYEFTTNLFESITVLALLAALALAAPAAWFRERFVAQASWLSVLGLGYLMAFSYQMQAKEDYPTDWVRWSPLAILAILLVGFAASRIPLLRRAAEVLADRAVVLLYLLLPLSAVSLVVVVLRNLL